MASVSGTREESAVRTEHGQAEQRDAKNGRSAVPDDSQTCGRQTQERRTLGRDLSGRSAVVRRVSPNVRTFDFLAYRVSEPKYCWQERKKKQTKNTI